MKPKYIMYGYDPTDTSVFIYKRGFKYNIILQFYNTIFKYDCQRIILRV